MKAIKDYKFDVEIRQNGEYGSYLWEAWGKEPDCAFANPLTQYVFGYQTEKEAKDAFEEFAKTNGITKYEFIGLSC